MHSSLGGAGIPLLRLPTLSDHGLEPRLLCAHVKKREVGPGAESPAFSVTAPTQPMYSGLLFPGIEEPDLPSDCVVHGRTHSSRGRELLSLVPLCHGPHQGAHLRQTQTLSPPRTPRAEDRKPNSGVRTCLGLAHDFTQRLHEPLVLGRRAD